MPDQAPLSATGAPQRAATLLVQQPGTTLVLLMLSVAGWAFLAWIAFDMGSPVAQLMMPGAPDWTAGNLLAIYIMWAVMMAAMMLPSALPMILVFVQLGARSGERSRARAFVAAYLLVWSAFSAAATALQWVFQATDWVDPMIVSTSTGLTALLLVVAGLYQFSPLKKLCLSSCRSPLGFLVGEWRAGVGGAFVMGVRHGLFCVGCCWALMGLLFVGGVMNLAWIAAVSIAVAVEKLAPGGARLSAALGIALLAAGAVKLLALVS